MYILYMYCFNFNNLISYVLNSSLNVHLNVGLKSNCLDIFSHKKYNHIYACNWMGQSTRLLASLHLYLRIVHTPVLLELEDIHIEFVHLSVKITIKLFSWPTKSISIALQNTYKYPKEL